jgi:hypothetical protein
MPSRSLRVVRFALVFLVPTFGLLAQHTGSSGAMSAAHFGPGATVPAHFNAGIHAAPSPSFSGPPRSFAPPSMARYPTLQTGQSRHWPLAPHHPDNGRSGVGYRGRFSSPYVYAGYPWLGAVGPGIPWANGMPYSDDQDEASAPQSAPPQADQPMGDYGQEPVDGQFAENAPPAFRPPYQGPVEVAPVPAPVHPQPATTLVFKDGRPSTQVHNYALTATTLYALDGESRQEIPLSLLDVPATVAANRAAGVDFALPVSR